MKLSSQNIIEISDRYTTFNIEIFKSTNNKNVNFKVEIINYDSFPIFVAIDNNIKNRDSSFKNILFNLKSSINMSNSVDFSIGTCDESRFPFNFCKTDSVDFYKIEPRSFKVFNVSNTNLFSSSSIENFKIKCRYLKLNKSLVEAGFIKKIKLSLMDFINNSILIKTSFRKTGIN
jgi:hypothetical protein